MAVYWWRNKGGPFYKRVNRRIELVASYGKRFKADESEVPKAFRKTLIREERVTPEPETVELEVPEEQENYEIVKNPDSNNRYNVVNTSSGKVQNSKPLTKKKAQALKEDLEG